MLVDLETAVRCHDAPGLRPLIEQAYAGLDGPGPGRETRRIR